MLNYIWSVSSQQQFAPNLLHWNSSIISITFFIFLKTLFICLSPVSSLFGSCLGESPHFFLEYCFLIVWIKGDSKGVLTVRCTWRKHAPTQFFPYNKTIPTLKDTRSPIKIGRVLFWKKKKKNDYYTLYTLQRLPLNVCGLPNIPYIFRARYYGSWSASCPLLNFHSL